MVSVSEEANITRLLSRYKNVAATKKDIIDSITHYKNLSYSRENFVFNDGSNKDLFNLSGTIPVHYKNVCYHIPVCIWLMDTHPNNAPLCYVKPTPEMHIKVSMYVDYNGKIYLPYLHDWQPSSSDLLGLIQVMIVTFADYMPVYSKPKGSVAPYPVQQNYPQPQPGPAGGNQMFPPYPAAANSNFPPYPPNNFGSYPPYPPATGSATSAGYPPYMPSGYPQPGAGYNTNYGTPSQTGTITEEHIKASLISAVEDKLRRRIQERVNQFQAEIQTLNRTKQELTEGKAKITENVTRLERVENELKSNITVLQDKQLALEKSLETLEKVDGIDVDEAVTTTAPLYRQLLNAFAEEAATEDAIYYMGEALRNGVIDLEIFLKHVRQLSRKQFMLRAIMQKCRQKAGLVG